MPARYQPRDPERGGRHPCGGDPFLPQERETATRGDIAGVDARSYHADCAQPIGQRSTAPKPAPEFLSQPSFVVQILAGHDQRETVASVAEGRQVKLLAAHVTS